MTTQIDLHGAEIIELPDQATPVSVGPTSIVGLVGSAPDAEGAVSGSLVIGAGNAAVKATAAAAGPAGNKVRVAVVVAGNNTALSVVYAAATRTITVNLATDGNGAATSTAAQVVAAWGLVNAVVAVATLALAAGSDGSGVMGAQVTSNLLGGQDDPFPADTPFVVRTSAFARRLGAGGELVAAIHDVWRTSGRVGATIVAVKTADDQDASIAGTKAGKTGLYALLDAASRTGAKPTLIGTTASRSAAVITALQAVAEELRAIPVAALDGADAAAAQTAARNDVTAPGRILAVWPRFVLADAAGTVRNATGLVLGHIVATDTERSIAESPSNRRLAGVLRTEKDVDWDLESRTSTANILSRSYIATAVRRRDGLYFWGNRLANGELITHRRVRYAIREALLEYILDYIDRNVDVPFVEFVLLRTNKFLRDRSLPGTRRWLTGGRAWFDPAENTAETLGQNQVTFSYDLGLFNVAEHLRFIETVSGSYNDRIISELVGG